MSLFEIHVSIELKSGQDEIRWKLYCKDHHYHPIKVFNVRGWYDVQNMMSKWCNRDSREEVIEYAHSLATQIGQDGFSVLRTKVEAMMLSCDDILVNHNPSMYWEFHFKVPIVN